MPKQDRKRNCLPQGGNAELLDVNIQQKPAVHTRDVNNTKAGPGKIACEWLGGRAICELSLRQYMAQAFESF